MHKRVALVCGLVLAGIAGAGVVAWQFFNTSADDPMPEALPLPPFPPRIAHDDAYEHCLALLIADPRAAGEEAERMLGTTDNEGARHCQALARIATGDLDGGAAQLEHLALASRAESLARASVLAQAMQARLQAGEARRAFEDANAAIALSPDDPELLIGRAEAAGTLGQPNLAVEDLTRALTLDGARPDALIQRAIAWRHLDRLDLAAADADNAITLSPDDPEALLERGILRQRRGDAAGARADWEKARQLDPNGIAAELAEQNLALLAAGPSQP
jgi:tetratricopeptide (TPR) repeat protein